MTEQINGLLHDVGPRGERLRVRAVHADRSSKKTVKKIAGSMSDLLAIVTRSKDRPQRHRGVRGLASRAAAEPTPTAPPAAGA